MRFYIRADRLENGPCLGMVLEIRFPDSLIETQVIDIQIVASSRQSKQVCPLQPRAVHCWRP